MFICKTTPMPLVPSTTPLSLHSEISERLFFHQHPCREPHFSISGVRKGQGVKSIFQYYIFSTLLPVFWENWGSFAAWLSVYIFFTRLYWNYNCVLWRLLLVACTVWRSCGPGEMKKNGPLLRDSITEEENAAAHWPFFLLPFLFSSRCQSLGMLNIRAGMVLKQTQQSQHFRKWFLSSIKVEKDEGKHHCEIGHYDLRNEIHTTDLSLLEW